MVYKYDFFFLIFNIICIFFNKITKYFTHYLTVKHAGHLENVIAYWNCDPTISYAYCWNNKESVIRGDEIAGIIIIILTGDNYHCT